MPVGEDPAGHGAQQDRRDGRGLHQSVSLHQLIAGGQFAENAVLGRRIGGGANPHQRIADKRIDTEADAAGAEQLQTVGHHHHPAFGKAIGKLADKRSKKNVSAHKQHLQDRLAPLRIIELLHQRQCGEEKRIVAEGRQELGADHRQHPFRVQRRVSMY